MSVQNQSSYSHGNNRKNNYGNSFRNNSPKPEIIPLDPNKLDTSNYVDMAEKIIKDHKNEDGRDIITTNQIRNLLELTNGIYEIIRFSPEDKLSDEIIDRIEYVKMRFVYAAGKGETAVRNFMDRSGMIECLNSISDKKRLLLICRYMEALVAYHKYHIK